MQILQKGKLKSLDSTVDGWTHKHNLTQTKKQF